VLDWLLLLTIYAILLLWFAKYVVRKPSARLLKSSVANIRIVPMNVVIRGNRLIEVVKMPLIIIQSLIFLVSFVVRFSTASVLRSTEANTTFVLKPARVNGKPKDKWEPIILLGRAILIPTIGMARTGKDKDAEPDSEITIFAEFVASLK